MSSYVRNPYTNRNAILNEADFFGRERELHDIYNRLLGGLSVSIIGERRTGKSSLMRALNFEGERESFGVPGNFRVAYADCQDVAGCDEPTVLSHFCEQFAEAMGLDNPAEPTRSAFKGLANDAHLRGFMPVLAIDEFDLLVDNDRLNAAFLAFLRSWTLTTSTSIVMASWEGSVDKLAENRAMGSAFLNIFSTVYVGPLEPEDATQLITYPAESAQEPFDDREIMWIRSMGGNHPFFLTMACFFLMEARRRYGPGEEAIRRATTDFTYDATPHLRFLLSRLSATEKSALEQVTRSGRAEGIEGIEALRRKGILIGDSTPIVFSEAFLGIYKSQAVTA